MSDAYTIVKCQDETMKEFNARIRQACQDNHVTDGQIDIVDGEPVVTLLWTEPEDISDDQEDDAQNPLEVLVARVNASTEDSAAKSEQHLGTIYEIANASIVDVQFATGPAYEWVTATDLSEVTKSSYKFAEVLRHNFKFGAEFDEKTKDKKFRPVSGDKSDPTATYDSAAHRTDTALIRYNASYALVAYLTESAEDIADDEDAGAEVEEPGDD